MGLIRDYLKWLDKQDKEWQEEKKWWKDLAEDLKKEDQFHRSVAEYKAKKVKEQSRQNFRIR